MNSADFMPADWRRDTVRQDSPQHGNFHVTPNPPPTYGGSSPIPSSTPSTTVPSPSGGLLENRVVSIILIGVILILVAIVVYLYFSTPKEAEPIQTPPSGPPSGPPHGSHGAKKRPTKASHTPPPPPQDEPEQVDKDGTLKTWAASRARRKEEVAAAKAAEESSSNDDGNLVSDETVVTSE